MNMSKTSKGALVISGVALLICFAMLLGTTWAWFTDEVTSAQNLIQSGELKIDLIHVTDAGEVSIKDKNEQGIKDYKVFDYDLWEPGYTQMETLKIVNEGNLALKYRLSVLAYNADVNTIDGKDYKLADVIDVYLFPGEVDEDQTTWAEAKKNGKYVGTLSEMIADVDGAAYGILLPKAGTGATDVELDPELKALLPISGTDDELVATLALHMREEAGNEYQKLSCGDLYLSLVATQLTWENDSFDNDYDTDALYAVTETLANVEGGAYEGDVINGATGDNYLVLADTYSTADTGVVANEVYDTIILENSIFDNNTAIVLNADNTVIMSGVDFILPEGGKLIVNNSGSTTIQVMATNITINGKAITTSDELREYLPASEGFGYVEVYNS